MTPRDEDGAQSGSMHCDGLSEARKLRRKKTGSYVWFLFVHMPFVPLISVISGNKFA